MAWPLSQDYNEAIQTPELSFSDPELRGCEAKCNAIGIPMPRSGNFADVYEMTAPSGKKWALKCFTRQVAGLRERYAAISAYLKHANLPFMVDFTYLEQGVKVKGQWYPALKMQWVEGFTFNEFVKEYADQPQYLELLSQIWLRVARRLREAKMAHADLQHGNVLLVPGVKATSLGVRLIDYDGMFVPALADKKSGEVGHPAYQHPQRLRESTYSVEVDRFPHLVIYTALRCLMVGGRYLWNKYDNGDNLLFRQQDLNDPASSALFAELRKLNDAEAGKLVAALAQAARQPLGQTPLLDQLVTDKTALTTQRKQAVGPTPAGDDTSPESLFASATSSRDSATEEVSYRRRASRKGNPWLWPTVALGVIAAGVAGAVFLLSGNRGTNKPSEVAVAPKNSTPEKNSPQADKQPGPKVDPKNAPKADPKVDPKLDPKVDPKNDPKVDPKLDPKVDPPPVARGPLSLQAHNGIVLAVAFSPDGKRLVSAGVDNLLKVWDAQTGQEVQTLRGHNRGVMGVIFSPDGKWIVSAGGDSTVKVWDAQTGQEVRTLQGHTDKLAWVAFSPDGKRLVSGGEDRSLILWDAQTGQRLLSLNKGFTYWVTGVIFSPDGKHLIGGGIEKIVRVWDAQTGQEIRALQGHTNAVMSVAMSGDGKCIVSTSRDLTVKVWDAQTGQCLQTFAGHTGHVICSAISPDGQRIASGSWDKTVRVWNWQEAIAGQPDPIPPPAVPLDTLTLQGHADQVWSVVFSPDGRRIISGSNDGTVRVWNAQTGQVERVLQGHVGAVKSVAVSPDGQRIISCGTDHTLKVWTLESGKEERTLQGHTKEIRSVAVSRDGKRIVSGSDDRTLKVWDAQTGAVTATIQGLSSWVNGVAISPDGKHIVSAGQDGMVTVWDAETGRNELTLKVNKGPVRGVAYTPDGKRIVSGGFDRILKVWDAQSGKLLQSRQGYNQGLTCVAVSPDGQRIVTGSDEPTVKVWDAQAGQELGALKGHTNWILSVAISPDGKRIASGSADRTVKVWALSGAVAVAPPVDPVPPPAGNVRVTAQEVRRFGGAGGRVMAVALVSDGKLALSSGSDGGVRVWDVQTGRELVQLRRGTGESLGVAASTDGQYLVRVMSEDSTVWDLETKRWRHSYTPRPPKGELRSLASLPNNQGFLLGTVDGMVLRSQWKVSGIMTLHRSKTQSPILALAVAEDGRHCLFGSADGMATLIDMQNRREVCQLQGHQGEVLGVALSKDGQLAVTAGADKTVRIWDVPSRKVVRQLTAHEGKVTSVVLSSDDRRAITGSADKTVRVWDVRSGAELHRFTGHTDSVTSVALSPDGRSVLSASADQTVRLWDLSR